MRLNLKFLAYLVGGLLALSGIAGMAAIIATAFSASSAGAALSCNDTFNGTTTGGTNDWGTATNWSAGLPSSTSVVCFASGNAFVSYNTNGTTSILDIYQTNGVQLQMVSGTLNLTDTTANAQSSLSDFSESGGTFTNAGPVSATSIELTGGVIGGSGTITDSGTFTWSDGDLNGSGSTGNLTVAGATQMNFSAATAQPQLNSYVLTTNGSAVINAPDPSVGFGISSSTLQLNGASTLDPGSYIFNNGGTNPINVGASADLVANGPATSYIESELNVAGTLSLGTDEELVTTNSGTSSGTFALAGGSTLALANQDMTGSTNITSASSGTSLVASNDTFAGTVATTNVSTPTNANPGTTTFNGQVTTTNVNVSTSDLQFDAAASVSNSITLAGGTLGGSATITDAGTFSWTSGSITGSGTGILSVAGTSTLTLSYYGGASQISSYELLANGTTTIGASGTESGFSVSTNGVVQLNGATNTIDGGVTILDGGGGSQLNVRSSSVLNVSGTQPVNVNVAFANAGSTTVAASGQLNLNNGGTSSGSFSLAASATLWPTNCTFSGTGTDVTHTGANTVLIVSASSIAGAVNVDTVETPYQSSPSTTTLSGSVTANTVLVQSSALALDGSSTTVNTAVDLQGGFLGGSGSIADAGTFTWTGGGLGTGNGGLVVAGATNVDLSATNSPSINAYGLTADGSTTIESPGNDAGFSIDTNALFTIAGSGNTIAAGVTISGGGSGTSSGLQVAGGESLAVTGTGTVSLNAPLTVNGTVNVPAGVTFYVSAGGGSGSYALANTAQLQLFNVAMSGSGNNVTESASGTGTQLVVGNSTFAGNVTVANISTPWFSSPSGSTFNGNVTADTVDVGNSQLSFDGVAATDSVSNDIDVSGGYFGGTAQVNDAGTLGWTGGVIAGAGGGVVVVSGTTTVSLSGLVGVSYLNDYALDAEGPISIGGPAPTAYLGIESGGQIDVSDPVTTDTNTIGDGVTISYDGGSIDVSKGTTLTVTGSSTVTVQASLVVSGVVAVPAGTSLVSTGSATDSGKFALGGSGSLTLENATMTSTASNAPDISTSPSGSTLTVFNDTFDGVVTATTIESTGTSNTTSFNGNTTVGTLDVSGTTVSMNGSATYSVATAINLSGGVFGGTGTVSDAGTLSWTGGDLQGGAGTLNVAGATQLTLSYAGGATWYIFEYTLNANGSFNESGSVPRPGFAIDSNATIGIYGSGTIEGGVLDQNSGATGFLVGSTGSLTLGGASATTEIDSPIVNTGAVSFASGADVIIDSNLTQSAGSITIAPGATIASGTSSQISLTGGVMQGTGDIGVPVANTSATVQAGTGTGTGVLFLADGYTQGTTGTLVANLASATAFSQLVTPNATISGSLDVNAEGGYVPSAGASFNLLQTTGGNAPSGTFATTTFTPSAVAAESWHTTYNTSGVTIALPIPPAVTVALTAAPNPASFGATVTLTGTATGPNGDPTPTGTITFEDGGTTLGSGPVTLTGGSAQLAVSTLAVGTHSLTAVYSGDGNYGTGTSPTVSEVIKPIGTKTKVSALPTSSQVGDTVQVTATITASQSGGPGPTGSVTFKVGSTTLGSANITTGTASIDTTKLPKGTDTITATYGGDSNYSGSSATTTETVSPATADVTLLARPGAALVKESITLVATVAYGGKGTSPGDPTGTVQFYTGSTKLGKPAKISSGTATLVTSFSSTATEKLKATYSGDSNYKGVSSSVVDVPIVEPGYRLVGGDGGVFDFGKATFHGTLHGHKIPAPIVGIANTNDAGGYWMVGSDGSVYPFGDAKSYGDLPKDKITASNVIGIAATPDSGGYWLGTATGKVYPFGDAKSYGNESSSSKPIVSIINTPDGKGYWMLNSAGTVYAFGDAKVEKSVKGDPSLKGTIVSISPTPDGKGYWLVSSTGVVVAYGDAKLYGSPSGKLAKGDSVVAVAGYPDGKGYYVVTAKGYVYNYGDAIYYGDEQKAKLTSPIFGISVYP